MTHPHELVPRVADLRVGDMLVGVIDHNGDEVLWAEVLTVSKVRSNRPMTVWLVGPGLKNQPYDWHVVDTWQGYLRLVG